MAYTKKKKNGKLLINDAASIKPVLYINVLEKKNIGKNSKLNIGAILYKLSSSSLKPDERVTAMVFAKQLKV